MVICDACGKRLTDREELNQVGIGTRSEEHWCHLCKTELEEAYEKIQQNHRMLAASERAAFLKKMKKEKATGRMVELSKLCEE